MSSASSNNELHPIPSDQSSDRSSTSIEDFHPISSTQAFPGSSSSTKELLPTPSNRTFPLNSSTRPSSTFGIMSSPDRARPPIRRYSDMMAGRSSEESAELPPRRKSQLEKARTSWKREERRSSRTEKGEARKSPARPSVNLISLVQKGEEHVQSGPSEGTSITPPRRPIAAQNQGSRSTKEDTSNLKTWDALEQHWLGFWATFDDWNNRRTLKHINASLHVQHTYHDSFLFGMVPLSLQARTKLRVGAFSLAWHMLEFILAIISGVLYVYSTYKQEAHGNWVSRCQNIISIFFFADYILRIYCEPVRLYYIISFWGIVDLLSAVPIILVFRSVTTGGSFIRLLQFIRILRLFALTNRLGLVGSSVTQQIILLSVATFGVIFLDAGILQWVEYDAAPLDIKKHCSEQGCITFWQALYFLIVTISTVGYGDITPKTKLGQFVAMVSILAALTVLPIQIGRITSLAYRRPYGGSYSTRKIVGSRFLIISGSISIQSVQNFLAEFYNPSHCEDLEVYPLRVIILAPFSPSFELKQVLSLYNGLVEFIEGSPVRQSDLERVNADKATAFFFLADKDAEVEDAAQIVRALAVHRFCLGNRDSLDMRIILEVLDPETITSAVWDESRAGAIEVICPAKIHYKMMARSCFVRGLYSLITNLFTSELQLKHVNKKHFLSEYFHSFDNEVYPVILPPAFHNLPFEEVADFLHAKFSSTLFAVDTVIHYKSTGRTVRKVLLNPRGHRIRPDDVGIVISSDLHTAFAMSIYDSKNQDGRGLRSLWDCAAMTDQEIRRSNQGIEMRDPTSGRWRMSLFQKRDSVNVGAMSPGVFPSGPDSQYKLENELRLAIRNVYTMEDDPDTDQGKMGLETLNDVELSELEAGPAATPAVIEMDQDQDETNIGFQFPKGLSLEKAAEDLLAWPPVGQNERPHPAVLDRRADVILENLRDRTISMVAFNTPHILVCSQSGWPAHFFYFLLELRKPGFPNPPVVILYPDEPTVKQWGTTGVFNDVYFIKGSPVYELDLMRSGVLQAERVVILSNQGVPVDFGRERGDDTKYVRRAPTAYTSDVENIIVAANVQRLYGRKPVEIMIVEMQHNEAFYYLQPQYEIALSHFPKKDLKRNGDGLVHFVLPFMEGKAVSSSMLGFLMRSAFYNRNTLSIVEQLVQGGYMKTEEGLSSERVRMLDQIAVPQEYANLAYSDLFHGLHSQGLLAIGLYRVRGTLGAPVAYVLTNPKSNCIVNADDLVYIIT